MSCNWCNGGCDTCHSTPFGPWNPLTIKPYEPGPIMMWDDLLEEMAVGSYEEFSDGSGEFNYPGRCIDLDKKERFKWAEMPMRP